ncbi:MAG TPA: glycoside hydrolase family 30 beta sandwich domain-containing protein [Parafilimonas sp.]|nr:glycoside hydrolase family 30 beta sandwich domain-containing protein [Parafilimonas sp.]
MNYISKNRWFFILPVLFATLMFLACRKMIASATRSPNTSSATVAGDVTFWLTKGDQSVLLQKQNVNLVFGNVSNRYATITVDTTQNFQSIDGFGYTLTGASAYLINHMSTASRDALLRELFAGDSNSVSVSYLRVSVGASDLSLNVFSYDDMPQGQTDVSLQNFSLAPDQTDVIPVLKLILAINPNIKILGTPWSPPVWMKTNGSSVGGSLQPQYYNVYANYLVKYVQGMKAQGITIDAITPQNEPLNPNNNPSMYMTAIQEDSFVRYNLGPVFQSNNISTKIILYDHNCDHPEYPTSILDDASTRPYVDGSAFHLYAGDISALTTVHNAYPAKNLYFTEQYTASNGNFGNDLKWHLKNVIIGSMRNWSRNALEWNLANDATFSMHTPGGCTTCKGAVTVSSNTVTRNVAYYIVAHASKFVPFGSIRIASNISGSLNNVAFKTPSGKKVLIVENDGHSSQNFNIAFNGKSVTTSLPAGGVGTYVW